MLYILQDSAQIFISLSVLAASIKEVLLENLGSVSDCNHLTSRLIVSYYHRVLDQEETSDTTYSSHLILQLS